LRALELTLLTGIILTVWARWWMMGWVWATMGLLMILGYVMGKYGAGYMNRVRKALGMVSQKDLKKGVRPMPAPPEVLAQIIEQGRPRLVASFGLGGLAAILLLMVMKPF
jgi:hypothetical protein